MKHKIFLLALCAYQTVFADDQFDEKLKNLRDRSREKMISIIKELRSDFRAALDDGRRRGLNRDVVECWNEFQKLTRYYESRFRVYENCYKRAAKLNNIKYAEDCFAENIAFLEKEEKKRRFNAKECITKHIIGLYVPEAGQHPAFPL